MKTLIFGSGENVERQYSNCSMYAMISSYEVHGSYDRMPKLIARLSQRDIDMVLMDESIRETYSQDDLQIVIDTFRRYKVRTAIVS